MDELFTDRTIAETAHFRVRGRDGHGYFVSAKHNINGPAGPSLSYGVTYYAELREQVEELRAELSLILADVSRNPNAGTLGQYARSAFVQEIKNRGALSLRFAILKRDGYRCQLCGRDARNHGVVLEVDHRIPRAKGGSSEPSNLWTLCFDCNQGKSDTDL